LLAWGNCAQTTEATSTNSVQAGLWMQWHLSGKPNQCHNSSKEIHGGIHTSHAPKVTWLTVFNHYELAGKWALQVPMRANNWRCDFRCLSLNMSAGLLAILQLKSANSANDCLPVELLLRPVPQQMPLPPDAAR
jgi:hypothetical protein